MWARGAGELKLGAAQEKVGMLREARRGEAAGEGITKGGHDEDAATDEAAHGGEEEGAAVGAAGEDGAGTAASQGADMRGKAARGVAPVRASSPSHGRAASAARPSRSSTTAAHAQPLGPRGTPPGAPAGAASAAQPFNAMTAQLQRMSRTQPALWTVLRGLFSLSDGNADGAVTVVCGRDTALGVRRW